MTPAAEHEMRLEAMRVCMRVKLGLHALRTRRELRLARYEAEDAAAESDFGALLEAVQADPLRRHFEDHEGEA